MAYQIPICHCGGNLLFIEMEYTEVQYKITKKGEKFKRIYDKIDKFGVDEQMMKCEECSQRYPWDYDDRGRIIIEGK